MNRPFAGTTNSFEILRGLARKRAAGRYCELCNLQLEHEHPHLLERASGRLLCACNACALLFHRRDGAARLLRIPRDARRLESFEISDADWSALLLPIELAFFVHKTDAGRVVAYYPSPAGGTESLLDLDAWNSIAASNPVLEQMLPDVEALLVNRTRGNRDYYFAPIDQCYKLTGIIRTAWRGLSGGDAVWRDIDDFFTSLRERAIVSEDTVHA